MAYSLDFTECQLLNILWPEFLEQVGVDKASQAIRQALDLQAIAGNADTLPILFLETCGVGLTTLMAVRASTGISLKGEKEVLIFSHRQKAFQILYETK